MTSGFRVYRAELLRAMEIETVRADGYAFQIEMTYRATRLKARIAEVPISFVDREMGKSKMSGAIVVEALLLVTRWGVSRLLSGLRAGASRLVEHA
jgi:dolichol-phosphate mannosyltransferase